jgi:hypothetical protein
MDENLSKLASKIVESVSSNVVHIANGYHKTIHVTCTSEGSSKSSEFYIQPGEVKKHTTSGWTDGTTVNIRVEAGERHLGTENIAPNRSIIIDKNGRILYAMYQRWWEKKEGEEERGKSYIWKCENGNWHKPQN